MSDLTEFLLARIAEDEAIARDERVRQDEWLREVAGRAALAFTEWTDGPGNPDRVLAECEAKRRIVDLHDFDFVAPAGAESSWDEFTSCRTCRGDVGEYPCPTLRALAAIWANHPDYRDEWRP